MSRVQPPSTRALLAVFVAVAASFLLSSALAQAAAGAIRRDALDVAQNSLPSVERLAGVRSELANLQFLALQLTSAGAGEAPVDRQEVQDARARLKAEAQAYRQLPRYPGEQALATGLDELLAAADGTLDALEGAVAAGEHVQANAVLARRLSPALDRASDEAYGLIRFNAEHANGRALDIERLRTRSERTLAGLDALCLLLSIGAGLGAARAVRFYARDAEARERALEERAGELEAFSGRVAHDILNPLNAISVVVHLLERRAVDGQGEVLERARRGVARVEAIVRGLLSFASSGARPTAGQRCGLREILGDAVSTFAESARAAGVTLQVEPGPDCQVACHPGVLTSLVTNLVGNALKYLGEASTRRIVVRARRGRERVRVEVEDTGPGVPREAVTTIFEPYVRAARAGEPGLGLGLATVRRLAVAHGGAAGYLPAPGGGSLFWFELPCAPDGPAAAPVQSGLPC